jgi:hypothetical protein
MSTHKYLIILFLILFTYSLSAQNYTFKVLAIKGNISADEKPLEVKSEFKAAQTLKINDDSSYIALYYAGKKEILEITKKGVYAGQDLVKQLNESKGWESDFFYYTLGELTQENTLIQKGRQTVAPIMAMLPLSEQKMYGTRIFLRWITLSQLPFKDKIANYHVMIYDTQDNLLYYKDTKFLSATLDFSGTKFTQQQILIIQIIAVDSKGVDLAKNFKADSYRISRLEPEKVKEISTELEGIFKGRNRDTAFSKLAEARYFEDKKLPIDAMQAFEQALVLSFNAEAYKKSYRFFLERNGMYSAILDSR